MKGDTWQVARSQVSSCYTHRTRGREAVIPSSHDTLGYDIVCIRLYIHPIEQHVRCFPSHFREPLHRYGVWSSVDGLFLAALDVPY